MQHLDREHMRLGFFGLIFLLSVVSNIRSCWVEMLKYTQSPKPKYTTRKVDAIDVRNFPGKQWPSAIDVNSQRQNRINFC